MTYPDHRHGHGHESDRHIPAVCPLWETNNLILVVPLVAAARLHAAKAGSTDKLQPASV